MIQQIECSKTGNILHLGDCFQNVEHDKVRKTVVEILNDNWVIAQDSLGNRREMLIETLFKRYFFTNHINMTAWIKTKLDNEYLAYQIRQQSVRVQEAQEKLSTMIINQAKASAIGLQYYDTCMRCLTESSKQPDCAECSVMKEVQHGI